MIYTFYSYKGGVGRSMALANVAEWFYQQGLRVVMIDWDLEAPGLESFFVPQNELERVRAKPGLIDMLLGYKDQFPLLPLTVPVTRAKAAAATSAVSAEASPTTFEVRPRPFSDPESENFFWGTSETSEVGPDPFSADEFGRVPEKLDTLSAIEVLERHLPPLEYFLYPIRPAITVQGQKQALWLLSSGWRTKDRFAEYGREVQNFSWSDFYENYRGEVYFEWMRKQLNSNKFADVVLIDSRTGLTEMGGVCTRQLADVVVSFTAPNIQNLSGVVAMTASFKKLEVEDKRNSLEAEGTKRPLEVIVVPTRIENSEQDEKNHFKSEFSEQLNEYPAAFRILKRTFWDLRIPYVPKYAYRERLAIGAEGADEDLQDAYKELAAHLVLLAPEGSIVRTRLAAELRRVFVRMLPRVLLGVSGPGENKDPWNLRERLLAAGLSLWDNTTERGNSADSSHLVTGNIELAEFLVLPVTREGVRSEVFQKQWRQARQQGVCIQLIRGEPDVELRMKDLPLWLQCFHIYDPARELDALISILKSPCITSRVPFMPPDLPESYVLREAETEELIARITSKSETSSNGTGPNSRPESETNVTSSHAPPRIALCGSPGCGKTALAIAACHDERVIAAFSGSILWVTLGETANPQMALEMLYGAVTGENKDSMPVGVERMLTAKLEGRNCLLVVNNVHNDSDLRPFLNLLSSGVLLFTTRNQGLAASVGADDLVIGEMKVAEALELLIKRSGISPGQEPALEEIISLMGYAPLPISLAGVALRQRLSAGNQPDVVDNLRQEAQARGVVAFDLKDTTGHEFSVAKSIAESLNHLADKEKDYFLKLSILPSETRLTLEELSSLWGEDELERTKLAKRFNSLSLLEYDPFKNTIRLSRLMHSFLNAQQADPSILNERIDAAERVFTSLTPEEQSNARRVLTRLVHVARPEDRLPDTRQRYDFEKFDISLRPIIATLQKAELISVEEGQTSDRSGGVQLSDDSLVQGWSRFRTWLDIDRPFLTWRQTLEPKIIEWESSKRHNREVLLQGKELAVSKLWLSSRKDDLNGSERLFIIESAGAAVKRKRSFGLAAGLAFAVVFVLTATAYFQYRSQRIAREKQEKTLKALGDTRLDENMNLSAGRSEASYRKEIAAYDSVIAENPEFAEAYDGRGIAYTGLGEYDKAEADYQRAVQLDPQYAEAWKDLGILYKLKGDQSDSASRTVSDAQIIKEMNRATQRSYEQAIHSFDQAINLKPDYIDAYFGRGDTSVSRGDKIGDGDKANYDKAIADYTRIIVLLRDKPTADAYYRRGLAYKSKGDNSNALSDFQRASELPGEVVRENILKNLQQLSAGGSPVVVPALPSIFIQYNDSDDEAVIKQVAEDLRLRGYRVVGRPQLSGGTVIDNGDVRCFSTSDLPNATKIALVVQESLRQQNYDRTIKPRDLKGYPNVPPGQIEVWVASLRISNLITTDGSIE